MRWRARTRGLLPYLVTAAVGFLAAYLVMFLFVFRTSIVPDSARVPDVTGMDYETAAQRLTAAGFRPSLGERRADATIAKNSVIEQSPRAGGETERGARVVLAVSAGRVEDSPLKRRGGRSP